jgi:hypothetical protein
MQLEHEIYDPSTDSFTLASDGSLGGNPGGYMVLNDSAGTPFASGRYAHVAIKLLDGTGRVLIAGGYGYEDLDETQNPAAPVYSEMATAFIFDPSTNSFTQTGSLGTARRDAMAVAYTDGRVLVFGGRDVNGTVSSSEIWDPSTGAWSQGPDMLVGRYEAATALTTNGLLVAGGMVETDRTTSPSFSFTGQGEMLDPSQGSFVSASSLNMDRTAATGTGLNDGTGNALVIGGSDGSVSITSIELFDASSMGFTSVGDLAEARQRHVATSLEGDALVVGGLQLDSYSNVIPSSTCETANGNGTVGYFGLNAARLGHTVTKLQDGRILILGGFQSPQTDLRGMDGVSDSSSEFFSRP